MALVPDRVWTDEDWDRIQRGYAARDMDEKWNIFVEADAVFMHRSWTGYGVYEASFAPVAGDGRRIVSAVVEGDGERYRSMGDEYDRLMIELIISAVVLGEPAADLRAGLVELTARASGKSDLPSGLVQHSLLGSRSGS
ncbi:hypothetical protein DN051_38990 [Streptomyces cadmiisoli]|uniref:Uncharacterized protein n=1 Tax=Streptomyces cadmiisoli TaxID=2184053 RepID=A0A2Z4JD93_9ACTN|nr:hypothetical protein DN051_38990 [Streptomyces cadmiisoli]